MNTFELNGVIWKVIFTSPYNNMLIDRTGKVCVATTDPNTNTVYVSNTLTGDFKIRVLLHEIGHCALFSFNLLEDIHRMVQPKYWIEAEEWVCNFIADYGRIIFSAAYKLIGPNALWIIPPELNRWLA